MRASEKARIAFKKMCVQQVKEEGKKVRNEKEGDQGAEVAGVLDGDPTIPKLESFRWAGLIDEARAKMPLLVSAVEASLSPKLKQKQPDRKDSVRDKRLGIILAVIFYTRVPRKYNFVQGAIGVELWRQGCSKKLFQALNHLGISLGRQTSRQHVDQLATDQDNCLVKWKSAVQTTYGSRYWKTGRRRSSFKQDPGYGVCWDNVQINPHRKLQGKQKKAECLSWALAFACGNRIPTLHLKDPSTIPASQLISSILPRPADYDELRKLMVSLVMRILVKYLPFMQSMKKHLPRPKHQYSAEMTRKSEVVNLGVLEVNPATTAGVVRVMEHLHAYVPEPDGQLCPILCSGDGLSVDRMTRAKRASINKESKKQQLQGLVECPQESHKEKLLLQDTMNNLYKGSSVASRGSLAHLKEFYRHRCMANDAKQDIQHIWDTIEFCTEAYVTLFAMTAANMETVNDVPLNFPVNGNMADKTDFVWKIAGAAVDFCWSATKSEDIRKVYASTKSSASTPGEPYGFCCCGKETDEAMIQCFSHQCPHVWYHLSCVGLDEPPAVEWYCSKKCDGDGTYIYCMCHQRKGGEMVQCALKQDCRRHEWYHWSCLSDTTFPDLWFCCDDCALGSEGDDSVQNYTKALMWRGLNHLARRWAVRHGDGKTMTSHWKMDLIEFWAFGHDKYLTMAQQFLTGVSGFLPERLRHDITWNRVANVHGMEGENIGLDLLNKFLNNEFKDMLLRSRRKYTQQQAQRCSQMSGELGKQIDQLLTGGLGDLPSKNSSEKTVNKDVLDFVSEFKKDALFDYVPGRHHQGFEDYTYDTSIEAPDCLGQRLLVTSQEMDRWNEIMES
ncbi:uncharacterized protein LOC119738598 [Patiria miniata]|uniref:Zinc finger PHD-type domain-containing protein n=1 Tax=Patiria miniata TaxID=46514 RepID=A0A914B0C8_PATMI|nr:uncharacterized protein LOC119738598 [Patiria miniata]